MGKKVKKAPSTERSRKFRNKLKNDPTKQDVMKKDRE